MFVKIEKDDASAPELISYDAENQPTGSCLDELVSLRSKYNETYFELQKTKDTLESLEKENVSIHDRYKQKETLLMSLEIDKDNISKKLLESNCEIVMLRKEIADANDKIRTLQANQKTLLDENSVLLRTSKSKAAEIDETKQQNRVLRARIDQIQQGGQITKASHNDIYNVEEILNHKYVKKTRFFLVRWEGYDSSEDSWVKQSDLQCKEMLQTYLKENNLK